ncbi:MAG: hypothetical protein ACI9MC_002401 [Kiritimatiellia bacterium]|jgi:hypothetical protein
MPIATGIARFVQGKGATSTLLIAVAALAFSSCAVEPDATLPAPDVRVDEGTDGVDILPADTTHGRDRRRMDIDQLAASIERVTGGIKWTEGPGSTGPELFEQLSDMLGKPDYAGNTAEDTEPGLLFQKFLDDAASSVCTKLVERELLDGGKKVLFVHASPTDTWESNPSGVERNIRLQLLRFHGRTVLEGSPELEPWVWLFRTTVDVSETPADAWRTMCVGLFTHPDFYTY